MSPLTKVRGPLFLTHPKVQQPDAKHNTIVAREAIMRKGAPNIICAMIEWMS